MKIINIIILINFYSANITEKSYKYLMNEIETALLLKTLKVSHQLVH